MRQLGWRVKQVPRDHCAVSMLGIGVGASRRVTAIFSISKSLLLVMPVGMGAKVSISSFVELARQTREAAPFGAADRPDIHGHCAS